MSTPSIPSGGPFNARIAEEKSAPARHVEGPSAPRQPSFGGYKTSHRDMTPSEAPTLDLPSAKTISDGIAAALHRMDREQAVVNGESREQFDARRFKQALAKAVVEGTTTNEAATLAWRAAYPHLTPEDVQ